MGLLDVVKGIASTIPGVGPAIGLAELASKHPDVVAQGARIVTEGAANAIPGVAAARAAGKMVEYASAHPQQVRDATRIAAEGALTVAMPWTAGVRLAGEAVKVAERNPELVRTAAKTATQATLSAMFPGLALFGAIKRHPKEATEGAKAAINAATWLNPVTMPFRLLFG